MTCAKEIRICKTHIVVKKCFRKVLLATSLTPPQKKEKNPTDQDYFFTSNLN